MRTNKTISKPRKNYDTIIGAQRELDKLQAKFDKEVEELRAKFEANPARGTSDLTEAVNALPLPDRVISFLRHNTANLKKLTKAMDADPSEVIETLHKEGKVYNIGIETMPIWTYVPGDEISTRELNTLVGRLLQERPFTTKELAAATGAKLTRVGGAVIQAQRTMNVKDLKIPGSGRAGHYFVMPSHARDATLTKDEAPETVMTSATSPDDVR